MVIAVGEGTKKPPSGGSVVWVVRSGWFVEEADHLVARQVRIMLAAGLEKAIHQALIWRPAPVHKVNLDVVNGCACIVSKLFTLSR